MFRLNIWEYDNAAGHAFIGAVVSNADWGKIHFDRQILLALFGRFVVCPLGIILMAPVIGIPPLMTQVFTIQAAMPAPSVLPVLAKNYGADYEYAATLTVVTTGFGCCCNAVLYVGCFLICLQHKLKIRTNFHKYA